MFKKLNEVIKKIKKIPYSLARHAFFTVIIIIMIDLIIGGILFYKYVIVIEDNWQGTNVQIVKFEEKYYQNVVNFWQVRQAAFDEILPQTYSNPFKEKLIPVIPAKKSVKSKP